MSVRAVRLGFDWLMRKSWAASYLRGNDAFFSGRSAYTAPLNRRYSTRTYCVQFYLLSVCKCVVMLLC